MAVWNWNWENIAVYSGGWWLALIGLALLLIGIGLGFAWGSARERRLQREYEEWHKKDFRGSWGTDVAQ